MKINNGPDLAKAEKEERGNIGDYMDQLALWTYKYIHTGNKHLLTRVRAVYENETDGGVEIEKLTPEEIGVVAVAGRYYKPNFPLDDENLEKEFAEYQFQLQHYLGITDPEVVVAFYDELISNVKPEHNKLIPILHTHHAQIHALKVAYDALKTKMGSNPSLTTRAIFGLICVEFMKLHVRLYLVEPLARTEAGKHLDWIYMLDRVFDDFTDTKNQNKSSLRKKNVFDFNGYKELGLEGIFNHIRDIRDEVDALKREKLGIPPERTSKSPNLTVNPAGYLRTIKNIRGRFGKGNI